MGMPVCRVGDAHACGAKASTGSPNVNVNGLPVHRVTDKDVHCGTTTQVEGSPSVFANGLAFACIGDKHAGDPCPHPPSPQSEGSGSVFAAS